MKRKEYKDVKKFTIKRSEWYRGKGSDDSRLLNEDKQKCCLGFYSLSCGLRSQDIRDMASPYDVIEEHNKLWKSFLITEPDESNELDWNSRDANQLMSINDDEKTSDAHKEKKIITMFKKHGIAVKFVD